VTRPGRPPEPPPAISRGARQLQAWLEKRQQTQRWLADLLRVSPAYVAMIFNGRRSPSLRMAKRFQDVTGIPATDFIQSRAA